MNHLLIVLFDQDINFNFNLNLMFQSNHSISLLCLFVSQDEDNNNASKDVQQSLVDYFLFIKYGSKWIKREHGFCKCTVVGSYYETFKISTKVGSNHIAPNVFDLIQLFMFNLDYFFVSEKMKKQYLYPTIILKNWFLHKPIMSY